MCFKFQPCKTVDIRQAIYLCTLETRFENKGYKHIDTHLEDKKWKHREQILNTENPLRQFHLWSKAAHVYSEASPIEFRGTYSQMNGHKIATIHCRITKENAYYIQGFTFRNQKSNMCGFMFDRSARLILTIHHHPSLYEICRQQ